MAEEKIPRWDIKNATYWCKNENWIFWRLIFPFQTAFLLCFQEH